MKKGNKGQAVKSLQYKLKKVLNTNIVVDGIFGRATEAAVKKFQATYNLPITGVVNSITTHTLEYSYDTMFKANSKLLNFGKRRFVVFVDAGHGGIKENGSYVTRGKRAYHSGIELHENGHYYEGYENRLNAEAFIEACTDVGIMCIRTYHPYKDTPISERTELVRSWLRRGYYGYLHSFHSNAISSSNSKEKLEDTQGFMVFNTRGNTFSDEIATKHHQHVRNAFGSTWTYREQKRKDGDSDFEVNFQILRETDLTDFPLFGAILDEWGFHTSKEDCKFITNNFNRDLRVSACLDTAKWVKRQMS